MPERQGSENLELKFEEQEVPGAKIDALYNIAKGVIKPEHIPQFSKTIGQMTGIVVANGTDEQKLRTEAGLNSLVLDLEKSDNAATFAKIDETNKAASTDNYNMIG